MCGIFGYCGTTDITKRMAPILAIFMNERGRDSWGVTDGTFVYKSVGQIVDQFDELDLESPVYHCRAASVGKVSVRNAHPFEYSTDEKKVIGVHNGHLSNWQALKTRFDRKDVEVDSEHIFMHLAEDKPTTDIEGWGAVVWFESVNGVKHQYFSKFSSGDLAVCKLATGELVFASTHRAIEIAAHMAGATIETTFKTDTNTRYEFINREIKNCGELKWGPQYPSWEGRGKFAAGPHPGVTYCNRESGDTRDICAMRECHTVVKDTELVCSWCFYKIKKEYGFIVDASVYHG